MSFYKEETREYFLHDTNVENMFINEYMVTAPGEHVKVYLFALMYAGLGVNITSEDIAKHLGMDIEDVLKAWTYWEKMGVIRKKWKSPDDKLSYDVEFILLKEQLYGDKTSRSTAPYSQDQGVGRIMGDTRVQEMFAQLEQILGRVISGTELREIASWISDYHAEPDVIIAAFRYSWERKKKSVKYVESVVRSWMSKGLNDTEKLQEYLAVQDRKKASYKRVFKALGFTRNATEEEMKIMDTWFDEMKFSLDKVLEACSRTAGISNPNISYVNKVLMNWRDEQDAGGRNTEGISAGEVMQYYDEVRRQENEAAELRRKEVYSRVPRIRQLEDELNSLSAEISRMIISDIVDKDKAIKNIRQRIDELNMERAFLLTDNGFEMDYMDVRYRCPLCQDTGVLETGGRCQCFGEVTKEKIRQTMANSRNQ